MVYTTQLGVLKNHILRLLEPSLMEILTTETCPPCPAHRLVLHL